jgi:hypothetical protein
MEKPYKKNSTVGEAEKPYYKKTLKKMESEEEKENYQYCHIRKDVRRRITFSSDIYYNSCFTSPRCGVADVDLNSNNVTIIDQGKQYNWTRNTG